MAVHLKKKKHAQTQDECKICTSNEELEEANRPSPHTRRTHTDKCNSVVWHDLSQRECAGASVTSAEVKRALCQGEVCTQIGTPPQLSPLRDLDDKSKLTSVPIHSPAVNVILQEVQLITRLRIAEPQQLSNLRLIGRILIDCTLQELAELLVELLVVTLLLGGAFQTCSVWLRRLLVLPTRFASRPSQWSPARRPLDGAASVAAVTAAGYL